MESKKKRKTPKKTREQFKVWIQIEKGILNKFDEVIDHEDVSEPTDFNLVFEDLEAAEEYVQVLEVLSGLPRLIKIAVPLAIEHLIDKIDHAQTCPQDFPNDPNVVDRLRLNLVNLQILHSQLFKEKELDLTVPTQKCLIH
jgi:hypothetical protein